MMIRKKAKECEERKAEYKQVGAEEGEYSQSETRGGKESRGEQEGSYSCQSDALVLQASFHSSSDGP